jgi:hypothetical protein
MVGLFFRRPSLAKKDFAQSVRLVLFMMFVVEATCLTDIARKMVSITRRYIVGIYGSCRLTLLIPSLAVSPLRVRDYQRPGKRRLTCR